MVKVIVIDDSLFMRTLISEMLNSDPDITVIDTAKEGGEALQKIAKMKPDCVTLDLAMPGWSGLTTLKHIMKDCPTPVVILSAHSKKDSDITMDCLEAGAISYLLKPSGELSLDIDKVKQQLLEEVKAAANVNLKEINSLVSQKTTKIIHEFTATNKIVVIGSSTGGPQTLELILSALPGNFPAPIIVVQHMPSMFFSRSFAEHLNNVCEIQVRVIEDQKPILPGNVYIIPGGFHLNLSKIGVHEVISFLQKDETATLTPSIDRAMATITEFYQENVIGMILTGMGSDGVQGMKAIKGAGGKTIVQDSSSMIFGMPAEIIKAGFADTILPANKMPEFMVNFVGT